MSNAPHAATDPQRPQSSRQAAIADFYCSNAAGLIRAVIHDLGGERERDRAEDGCQAAWLALLSADGVPLDGRAFSWLRITATRSARRQRRERERPSGALSGDGGGEWELSEPQSEARGPLRRVLAAEAQEEAWIRLRALRPRERRLLGLRGLGLSQAEIAELTGDSPRTVERQVHRGLARLRTGSGA